MLGNLKKNLKFAQIEKIVFNHLKINYKVGKYISVLNFYQILGKLKIFFGKLNKIYHISNLTKKFAS